MIHDALDIRPGEQSKLYPPPNMEGPYRSGEVLAFAIDEAQLYAFAQMAASAAVSGGSATFSGTTKDGLQVGTNLGHMSIIHGGGGEETGELSYFTLLVVS